MKKSYILVIDSGVGGVSILKELKKTFKNESFIYLCDNLNAPYGNKTKKFLTQNIISLIKEQLKIFEIKLIVFACNTLTASSIQEVRKTFNIKIVGIEPNIKALFKSGEKGLVLATNLTKKHSKILKQYKSSKIKIVGLKNVAKLLDDNFNSREKVINELKRELSAYKNYNNVVLGCTHYNFLKEEIKLALNNCDVKFYDSIDGIIKRVEFLLKINKLENLVENEQEVLIFTTKSNKNLLNNVKKIIK